MSDKPIELRPEDVIKRPDNIPTVTGPAPGPQEKDPGFFKQVKETFENIKEFKKMAEELGINIPGMPGGGPADPEDSPAGGTNNQTQQLRLAVQILRAKYGDVTVKQLIEKLLTEYGDRRLSSF